MLLNSNCFEVYILDGSADLPIDYGRSSVELSFAIVVANKQCRGRGDAMPVFLR